MGLLITLAVVLGLAAGGVHAGEARAVLDRLFRDVTTLDGAFRQEVFDEQGALVQHSSGTLKLARPGRFRWDYRSPYEQLIVSDGARLWVYDAELAQVTVRAVGEALGATPMMLLSEARPVDEDFVVASTTSRDGLDWVTLQPKLKDTDFHQVTFGLDRSGIRQMELVDQFGQRTVIHFENMSINSPIPESVFRFDIPNGVDVIGEPG